jgi:DNA repair protein RecO (recombination protein O)
MPYERAHGVVIRHQDYSETSEIITFYTRETGRLVTLAKGVKRKYSKMMGHVDLFSYGEIIFSKARFRDRLSILTEAAAFETFPKLRVDLAGYYAACHAAELLLNLTAEDDACPELFDEFLGMLRRLEEVVDPAVALYSFEAHLLVLTGFMPEVSCCVVCGKENRERRTAFGPSQGGVVCSDCAPGEPGLVRDVPTGALTLLGRLARRELTRLDRITIPPSVAKQMRTFLDEYETFIMARPLKSSRQTRRTRSRLATRR